MGIYGGKREPNLTVHVATWNMNVQLPPEGLPPGMLRTGREFGPEVDIYAVGVQEGGSAAQLRGWVDLLGRELGEDYVLVAQHNLGGMHLAVFMKRLVAQKCFEVRKDAVSCGIGNFMPNKGGVGIIAKVGSTRLLFINAHLAAHQDRTKQRNADYRRISAELFRDVRPKREPLESMAEAVFWFGDLNYRIRGNRRSIDCCVERRMMDVMRANDSLMIERAAGNAFVDFSEGAINFLPTYKFDVGSDVYDTSQKQRVPSWTDRILYKVRAPCIPPSLPSK